MREQLSATKTLNAINKQSMDISPLQHTRSSNSPILPTQITDLTSLRRRAVARRTIAAQVRVEVAACVGAAAVGGDGAEVDVVFCS